MKAPKRATLGSKLESHAGADLEDSFHCQLLTSPDVGWNCEYQFRAFFPVCDANGVLRPLVSALFCFGDSTADTGTNTYLTSPAFLANFSPYGETFFNKPTGRFCDGRLFVDFLAQQLGLPLLRPFLEPGFNNYYRGVNFASAGSGFLPSTKTFLAGTLGTVVNIQEQLQQFMQVKANLESRMGLKDTSFLLKRSIYLVSSASNDAIYSFLLNQTTTPEDFISRLIVEIGNTYVALYNLGARKVIGTALGPIGCIPSIRGLSAGGSCLATVNDLALAFNVQLDALQARLKEQLPDFNLIIANNYDIFNEFIFNGTSFGPFNGAIQCGTTNSNFNSTTLCSKAQLSKYVFFDNNHPTEKTYGLLAQMFMTGGAKVVKPFNVSTLALCD
ncbi:hypothetical protein AXG93_3309s1220 [Marchantia polymorpha subsp. ruderalis]|uniref:GDSL esterase/lipase n=1 Tax=Marchantia polymorpha subsp. ruderalis TaxID=1480154 RepID=A0A176W697_MARPO|nr:hypothetical protein AXG93_3309s1220 [Marchantia polymorpha subsp. ruderalis]